MTWLAERWRALPFAVRLAAVIVAGAGAVLLVARIGVAGALPVALLAPALLKRQADRARDAADAAADDAAAQAVRRNAAADRAVDLVEAQRANDHTFRDALHGDLAAAGDNAVAAARKRLGS